MQRATTCPACAAATCCSSPASCTNAAKSAAIFRATRGAKCTVHCGRWQSSRLLSPARGRAWCSGAAALAAPTRGTTMAAFCLSAGGSA
eukprot:5292460-Alexandrium_andersonii.AAC.1